MVWNLREDISMNIPGMIIDNITDILESKAILLWKEIFNNNISIIPYDEGLGMDVY